MNTGVANASKALLGGENRIKKHQNHYWNQPPVNEKPLHQLSLAAHFRLEKIVSGPIKFNAQMHKNRLTKL